MKWLGATLVCLMIFVAAHGAFAQQPSAEEAAADEAAANTPPPPPPPKSITMGELLQRVQKGWSE